jgi:hypothetical protein
MEQDLALSEEREMERKLKEADKDRMMDIFD